jgi:hypothetical protein
VYTPDFTKECMEYLYIFKQNLDKNNEYIIPLEEKLKREDLTD